MSAEFAYPKLGRESQPVGLAASTPSLEGAYSAAIHRSSAGTSGQNRENSATKAHHARAKTRTPTAKSGLRNPQNEEQGVSPPGAGNFSRPYTHSRALHRVSLDDRRHCRPDSGVGGVAYDFSRAPWGGGELYLREPKSLARETFFAIRDDKLYGYTLPRRTTEEPRLATTALLTINERVHNYTRTRTRRRRRRRY